MDCDTSFSSSSFVCVCLSVYVAQKHTETHTDRDTHIEIHTLTDTHTKRNRHIQTHTDIQTHTQTHTPQAIVQVSLCNGAISSKWLLNANSLAF